MIIIHSKDCRFSNHKNMKLRLIYSFVEFYCYNMAIQLSRKLKGFCTHNFGLQFSYNRECCSSSCDMFSADTSCYCSHVQRRWPVYWQGCLQIIWGSIVHISSKDVYLFESIRFKWCYFSICFVWIWVMFRSWWILP